MYYRLVLVDKAEFFESVVSARISEVFKQWQTLGKQRDTQAWLMYPSMVNAYFNPPANEIVFPAGILQPPFFNAKWPAYLQYGAFGAVAAHELTVCLSTKRIFYKVPYLMILCSMLSTLRVDYIINRVNLSSGGLMQRVKASTASKSV